MSFTAADCLTRSDTHLFFVVSELAKTGSSLGHSSGLNTFQIADHFASGRLHYDNVSRLSLANILVSQLLCPGMDDDSLVISRWYMWAISRQGLGNLCQHKQGKSGFSI